MVRGKPGVDGKRKRNRGMKRGKQKGRKILSMLLVIFLMGTSCSPAMAATARATTMKLEKTEGKVKIKTQNGTTRKISKGMRLYNGNTVETAKSGYAYISLDSSKAVKLDESSKAALRQNGKKLELLVKDGQLFFNVSKKLKDDEKMDIRTSTMITGIRGTCGIVEVVSPKVSKLHLLEGKVSFGGSNPVTVHGGQTATVHVTTPTDKNIVVTDMVETDLPVFAIKEVLKDSSLQEKIEKTTDLSVEKMEEVIKQEEEKPEEPEKPGEPEKPVTPETPENPTTPGEPTTPENPTTPGKPTTPENPTTPGESTDSGQTPELAGEVTVEQLEKKWADYDEVTLLKNSILTVTGSETVTVGDGKKLNIAEGAQMDVQKGGNIQIQGSGELVINGLLVSEQELEALKAQCIAKVTNGNNVRYYYGESLNAQMAEKLNALSKEGLVFVKLHNDVKVVSDVTLQAPEKQQMKWDTGNYAIQVASGFLAFASNIVVTGSGERTIHLTGGTLVLGEKGKASESKPVIQNENQTGMVIQVDESAYSSGRTAVVWNDFLVSLKTAGESTNTITGLELKEDNNTAVLPSYISVEGNLVWKADTKTLARLSNELTGSVSREKLQAALDAFDLVVLTKESKPVLDNEELIRVPAGKSLQIESEITQITGTDQIGYSGGFAMKTGSILLEHGATLIVKSAILGKGTIEAGDSEGGADIKLESTGRIIAEKITLKAGKVINEGVIDIGEMKSTGNSVITNHALIKINRGYTYTSDAQGTDQYNCSPESVLISNEESTALPEGKKLTYAYTQKSAEKLSVQFYYADYLNERVADYMNKVKTDTKQSNDVQICWNFLKNAIVNSGTAITLNDFNAVMNEHEIQVAGSLTLTDTGTVTGQGEAVIRLMTGGKLTLKSTDSTDSTDGITEATRVIRNEVAGKYVVAVEETISDQMKSHIEWYDDKLRIQTEGTDVTYAIQGVKTGDTGIESNPWITLREDYGLHWDDKGTLSLTK